MEKMSGIFLVIIVAYLLYSFVKSRFDKKESQEIKKPQPEQQHVEPGEKKEEERAAIAALIAAVMGDVAFVVKRIYPVATVDEKKSTWRYAGRNELMLSKKSLR